MNKNELLEYLNNAKCEQQLKSKIKEFKNKKIVFYGMGSFFHILNEKFDLSAFNIVGVCDKKFNDKYATDKYLGYKIIKYKDLSEIDCDCILVSTLRYGSLIKDLSKNFKHMKFKPLIQTPIKEIFIENFKKYIPNKQNLCRFKTLIENKLKLVPCLYELLVLIPQKVAADHEYKDKLKQEVSILMSKDKYPLFELVEVETLNRCNGTCAFCPVNRNDDQREFKLMDEALFKKIILELKELNYDGRLQLFSNNEPFMDKRIFDFAKFARENCPNAHIVIFTNGILLDLEKFKKIIDYIDTFCIDNYYDGERKVGDNIKEILIYCSDKVELKNKVIVQMIDKNAIRNNRGSKSKNRHFVYQLKSICKLPFLQVVIRPDGKLSLCCNDAMGQYTLGDLQKETLKEIWYSDKYSSIRKKFFEQGRKSIDICKYCDNFGGTGINGVKNIVFPKSQYANFWRTENIKNLTD